MTRTPAFPPSLAPSPTRAAPAALLSAGDRVRGAAPGALYEIVHISRRKAWVRPLGAGSQCIVPIETLRLVVAAGAGGHTLQ